MDQYNSERYKEESSYSGLPLFVFKYLKGMGAQEPFENIEYTPELTCDLISRFFENKTIHDFARSHVKRWLNEFYEKYNNSYDQSTLIKKEFGDDYYIYKPKSMLTYSSMACAVNGQNPFINEFVNWKEFENKSTYHSGTIGKYIYITEKLNKLYGDIIGYAEIVYTHDLKLFVEKEEQKKSELKNTPSQIKLKWKGTPSQFGYIIQELIGNGYIEKPSKSYIKDAETYLEIFDIETTSRTLAKEISSTGDTQNTLSAKNRALFKIPHISKLK